MGSNSQDDLEEIPQPIQIATFPIHGKKSTVTLTYLKEVQIWLRRAWKELGRGLDAGPCAATGAARSYNPTDHLGNQNPQKNVQIAFNMKSSSSEALKGTTETTHVSPTISPAQAGRRRGRRYSPQGLARATPAPWGARGDLPQARLRHTGTCGPKFRQQDSHPLG